MNTEENRRILLIDDTPAIHEDFRKILLPPEAVSDLEEMEAALFGVELQSSPVRFTLDSAYQGAEGVAKVREALEAGSPYALAFVDMRMPPGWDGMETVERLWQIDPKVQVVICTAYSDYSWQQLTKRLDVGDRLLILKKPFDAIEVCQLASTLTAKWHLSLQAEMKMAGLEEVVGARTAQLAAANQALKEDIVRREAAEREARDSYQRLADILEFLPDPTFVVDEERRVIAWNRALEKLTGVGKEKVLGDGDYAYAVPFYGMRRRILIDLLEEEGEEDVCYDRLRRDGQTLSAEVKLLVRGEERFLWSAAAPLYDMQGNRVGGIQTLRDITDLRNSEMERTKLEARLRHSSLVRSLMVQLSHDLRTPITPLFALLPMVKEKVHDQSVQRMLEVCERSANQILGLTTKVVELVRLSSGSVPVELAPVRLAAVVQDAVVRSAPLLQERGVSCCIELDPALTVLGATDQLALLFENLFSNAARYAAQQGKVRVWGIMATETVTIGVEDDGVGLDAEHCELIFDEFFKADTARHDVNTQGLGLALCKRIVQNHKGSIWAESPGAGQGTTIFFTLKLAA
ncbi:ATP-binding protein [Geomonas sp. RF6]|uniref:hybrid sensor histidine kinase/response regulator n=1 Tax=Geomonas sp. RF6 TaxID=2897342 RepID=UPI001E614D58|nr:hybrid sensor histidine kinase/response regulator [Geomonas sp. RF6]UFS69887.1 ATP-binding protein [Geomonas sp. RF6]